MSDLKGFYGSYHDEILEKRLHSPYLVRRAAHEAQYESILRFVEPGMRVLDAGCGEGALSIMMAKKGAVVTGCDISEPNVRASDRYAEEAGVSATFLVADGEALPFPDSSFDLVVSSHVLEHLPHFEKGFLEVMRITKKRAVIALPTIGNPCSWVQVGGGWFFLKGPRSFVALPVGFFKMLVAWVLGKEGVDEGYAGEGLPHVFRFPRVLRRLAHQHGFRIAHQEASTVCLPFFESLLPLTRVLDRYRSGMLRGCGYGTTYVVEK